MRLRLQADVGYSEVGRVLRISKRVVGRYVALARVAGDDSEVADGLIDDELEVRLHRPALARCRHQLALYFGVVRSSVPV